jgi:DNA polymerase II small subunit
VPRETPVAVARELASRGYNADREVVTLIASAPDPQAALERAVDAAPRDAVVLRVEHVRSVLDGERDPPPDPSVSTGARTARGGESGGAAPVETEGSSGGDVQDDRTDASTGVADAAGAEDTTEAGGASGMADTTGTGDTTTTEAGRDDRDVDPSLRSVALGEDVTGESTGTGTYEDFVSVFRDRYEQLSGQLRGRVNHRPAEAIQSMPGNSEAAMVGMVNDVRSTASGHRLVELEDPSGVFPWLVMKDRDIYELTDELLLDEVIAVEGTLADDAGIAFVDAVHFPDVPRTYSPSTADREVSAALVSDLHVGSEEFLGGAWSRFADWLHTPEGEDVEYLLIAGDMVEGVGVYPGQEDELTTVDIYDQYEAFSERLEEVPGDMEVVMIPGNHDAVRLAEPQPAFDEELRDIMSAHDARVVGNPAMVTVEGVSVLMYHGVSLDEVIAELPGASYDDPHRAMEYLLKKRHLAPQYGGRMRVAPEERDWLVVDEVPDVFHAGHVHKLGVGGYHNVRVVNSGCWQAQTTFQKSVNIEPDAGLAPILELDTLEMTVRKFR